MMTPERAKLRTNASAAFPSRALAICWPVAAEALALQIRFPEGKQRHLKAGREIWAPLWAGNAEK